MMAARETALPVWLAVSVHGCGRHASALGRAALGAFPFAEMPPDAILINCAPPEAITQGIGTLRGFGLPFGAYANGFTRISEGFLGPAPTVDALERRHDLGPAAHAEAAMGWIGEGPPSSAAAARSAPTTSRNWRGASARQGMRLSDAHFFWPQISRGCGGWPPPRHLTGGET